ncbi:MAG: hypothetical protein ACHREM_30095, partial [Polyangiales bacterium]
MRFLRLMTACAVVSPLALLAASCASTDPTSSSEGPVAQTSAAITDGCTLQTLFAPCVPPPALGVPFVECQGMCVPISKADGTGIAGVSCILLTDAGAVDGLACGGISTSPDSCDKACSAGACVARTGGGGGGAGNCRPTGSSGGSTLASIGEGRCGGGIGGGGATCQAIPSPFTYVDSQCSVRACATAFGGGACQTVNKPQN